MNLNQQPVEKVDRKYSGDTLDVHSIFPTIQGEGPFCGHRATFVRLAGCNLQCPWCDTEYTIGRQRTSLARILESVEEHPTKLVVLTGGEPFRQPVAPLLDLLTRKGYTVQVETNGTLPPPHLDGDGFGYQPFYDQSSPQAGVFVVCSPKTGKINPDLLDRCCALKYVLDADDIGDDGLPNSALGHSANPRLARPPRNFSRPVYLQPADHQDYVRNQRNLNAVVRSCMVNGYIIQLQIHKYLGLE